MDADCTADITLSYYYNGAVLRPGGRKAYAYARINPVY